MPQLFRVRLVENFYRNICSIRKTAKLLGLGRSTVHHYLKYYRHSNIASLSHREQAQTLKEFLNEKDTLLPIADPNMDNGTGNHHLLTGDEASLTQC